MLISNLKQTMQFHLLPYHPLWFFLVFASRPLNILFLKPLEDLPITYRQFNFSFCSFPSHQISEKILSTSKIVLFFLSLLSSWVHVRQHLLGFFYFFFQAIFFLLSIYSLFLMWSNRRKKLREIKERKRRDSLFILNYYTS